MQKTNRYSQDNVSRGSITAINIRIFIEAQANRQQNTLRLIYFFGAKHFFDRFVQKSANRQEKLHKNQNEQMTQHMLGMLGVWYDSRLAKTTSNAYNIKLKLRRLFSKQKKHLLKNVSNAIDFFRVF